MESMIKCVHVYLHMHHFKDMRVRMEREPRVLRKCGPRKTIKKLYEWDVEIETCWDISRLGGRIGRIMRNTNGVCQDRFVQSLCKAASWRQTKKECLLLKLNGERFQEDDVTSVRNCANGAGNKLMFLLEKIALLII